MHIHFTEQAEQELVRRLGNEPFQLQLAYDTEGCGCAVNGVPALWALPEQGADPAFVLAGAERKPVALDPRHVIFFDERMTIDYTPATLSFVLKSDAQIFNGRMQLTDKR